MKKYALVVGISKYTDPQMTDLNYAVQDARYVATCLEQVRACTDVRLSISDGDLEPDHVNIVGALQNLTPLTSKEDLFLFYFAGHRIQTGSRAHVGSNQPGRLLLSWAGRESGLPAGSPVVPRGSRAAEQGGRESTGKTRLRVAA